MIYEDIRMDELFMYKKPERDICEKEEIDLNGDDISDVILEGSGHYFNLMTGDHGDSLEAAVRDRRYILFENSLFDERKVRMESYEIPLSDGYYSSTPFQPYGYYVKVSEKAEMLILVYAEFSFRKRKWEEVGERSYFSDVSEFHCVREKLCDICGQYIDGYNYPILSKQRTLDFFCGPVDIRYRMNCRHLLLFDRLEDYEALYREMNNESHMESYKIRTGKGTWFVSYPVKSIHQENEWLLDGFNGDITVPPKWNFPKKARPILKKLEAVERERYRKCDKKQKYCLIHRCRDRLILRSFVFDFIGEECTIREFMRQNISKLRDAAFDSIIVYRDEFPQDSKMQYGVSVVDECIKMARNISVNEAITNTFSDFFLKYGCNPEFAPAIMMAMNDPCFEQMIKLDNQRLRTTICKSIEQDIKMMGKMGFLTFKHIIESHLTDMLGNYEPKENFYQSFCIPKKLLELCMEEKVQWNKVLRVIKSVYYDNGCTDYFMRLNENSLKELVAAVSNMLLKAKISSLGYGHISGMLCIMMRTFGHSYKNVIKYSDTITSIIERDKIVPYSNYIEDLDEIASQGHKDIAEKLGWNIDDKRLEKNMCICETLLALEEDYDKGLENFNRLAKEWETYAYEADGYVVTWPKKPEDVVMEGIRLHHCAKDFLHPVINGQTSLFFIRRKKELEKPYFTVEIKDGTIRQVHGFDNGNPDEKLKKFVEKFAEAKNISYNAKAAKELLGPIYDYD